MNKLQANFVVAVLIFALAVDGNKHSKLILGKNITLHCPVRAKGKDLWVKSVTWSKNGQEFYKYDPDFSPYAMIANIDGIQITDDFYYNGTQISLGPATFETAGFYKCVVELYNPNFPGLRFALNVDIELTFE